MSGDVRATRLVVERELREAMRRKALWVTAGLALLASLALMIVPELVGSSGESRTIGTVGTDTPLADAFVASGAAAGVEIHLEPLPDAATARQAVDDGDVDAAVVAGGAPDGGPSVIAEQADDRVVTIIRQAVTLLDAQERLRDAGLSDAEIAEVMTGPEVPVEALGADHEGRVAAAAFVSLALYIMLILVTSQVANGVAVEKSNRVSEVLLAIVNPRSLLFGKVIGVGITGLVPVLCAAVPVLVKLAVAGGLPPGTGAVVASGAAWFVFGAGLYLLIAGGLGALVERQEEVGSAIAVLTAALIASYIIGQAATDTALGTVLAYVPFSSPMVEPARLALGVSSPVEVVGSLVIGIASVVLAARLATVVYRRAVVRTGQRLHLRDVLRPR